MYHFFVEPFQIHEEQEYIEILGGDVNHIENVLRMKQGEELTVSDGFGSEYRCSAQEFLPETVKVKILEKSRVSSELRSEITLFQCLPKGDKMELIIQKAVELGASRIVPVASKRCVVRLDEKKAQSKVKRWQAIAESAAKQSGRMMIPQVHSVLTMKEAFAYAKGFDVNLIPYELAEGMKETKAILEQVKPGMRVGIFIGPEGGFDVEEVETAMAEGIHPITLGRRILRTETAGMTMLSILMFQLEQ